MDIYDPYYAPNEFFKTKKYDFITATEVVEHLAEPGSALDHLWSLINRGGWLAIMTKRVTSLEAFANWHYKNDPTHISFSVNSPLIFWRKIGRRRLNLLEMTLCYFKTALGVAHSR